MLFEEFWLRQIQNSSGKHLQIGSPIHEKPLLSVSQKCMTGQKKTDSWKRIHMPNGEKRMSDYSEMPMSVNFLKSALKKLNEELEPSRMSRSDKDASHYLQEVCECLNLTLKTVTELSERVAELEGSSSKSGSGSSTPSSTSIYPGWDSNRMTSENSVQQNSTAWAPQIWTSVKSSDGPASIPQEATSSPNQRKDSEALSLDLLKKIKDEFDSKFLYAKDVYQVRWKIEPKGEYSYWNGTLKEWIPA